MTAFHLPGSRAMDAHEQMFYATTMIGYANANRFFGSGFFVSTLQRMAEIWVIDQSAKTFLVTAQHVIAEARFSQRPLCMMLSRFDAPPISVPLTTDGWLYAPDGSDLAVLPVQLLTEWVEGGFAIPTITRSRFYVEDWRSSSDDYRLGDTVRAVGLWYGSATPQLIVRSGHIATATLDQVQTPVGRNRMYLADLTVTRAMSGGPVYATSGKGWDETHLLGITHGYWPLPNQYSGPSPSGSDESTEDRVRRELLSSIERLNSRLALVTPVHHLAALLESHPDWTPKSASR